MEIRLQGRYTEQDIRRGFALMRGRGWVVVTVAFLVLLIGPVLPIVPSMLTRGGGDWGALAGALLPAAVLALAILGLDRATPWLQMRRIRNAPVFRGPISGLATDDGLELRSEHSQGKTLWSGYVRYKMSDQIVLLYHNKSAASFVPRGLFASDADWEAFRQAVRERISGSANQRKSESAKEPRTSADQRVGDERGRDGEQGG